jgi:hypothetical protein
VLRQVQIRAATTPGRLRVVSLGIVAVLIIAGVVAAGAVGSRQRATRNAGLSAEPLLVGTQSIYTSLADADATASGTFLLGGIEPLDQRQHYLDQIKIATDQLADVTRRATSTNARTAVQAVTNQIPVYTGLIESARANNHQNLPVGAAYLRQASSLMRAEILPAASRLYQLEYADLHQGYSSARSVIDFLGVALVGLAVLAVLIGTQVWVAGRSNRVFNLPLAAATLLVLALTVWVLVSFSSQHHALAQAKRQGSDGVEMLSRSRSLLLQAEADDTLALVARGSGQSYVADFKASTDELSQLLPQATKLTGAQPQILADYKTYLAAHNEVRRLDDSGDPAGAVNLAVVSTDLTAEHPTFTRLNNALATGVDETHGRFTTHASSARGALSGLNYGIPILIILGALLALAGIQQRINDYR